MSEKATTGGGVRLRALLEDVPAYKAGKAPAPTPGLRPYKLSSNENPYPPLPSVLRVIAEAAQQVNRYPDPGNTALRESLARHVDVDPESIVLGTGSVDVLAKILAVTCDPGAEVVYAWRSFEAYPIVTRLADAVSVQVPLTPDARHDLPAMLRAITERTRVVLLCTPNNPTGPVLTQQEVDDFLEQCPRDVLVVIDEAYVEFVHDEKVVAGVPTWRAHPNVLLLRTFSKAYGLAGLRVGYAVCHPDMALAMAKAATPFGVNLIAQAAALASIDAMDELAERVAALGAERERVVTALRDQGWEVPSTEANFLWLPLGERTVDFAAACEAQGLAVRAFPGEGVRVTVAEREANDRFLQVAQEHRKG